MWFKVKVLHSKTVKILVEDAIYEIKEIRNKAWERKPFSVEDIAAFNARMKAEKSKDTGTEYGIVEGEWMYRIKLLQVSETQVELETSGDRVVSAKRLSTSDTRIPLKYFIQHEEASAAKADDVKEKKVKKHKSTSGTSTETSILQKYNKMKSLPTAPKQSSNKIQPGNTDNTLELDNEALCKTTNNKESSSLQSSEAPAEQEADQLENDKSQENADVDLLKMRIKALEEELAKEKSKPPPANKLLSEIAKQTKKISDRIGDSNGLISCKLDSLKMAVPSLDDEDIEVPAGHTYIGGDKKFVSNEKLAQVDEMYGTFTQKGEALFKVLTGEDICYYAKTKRGVRANRRLGVKLIPENIVLAMTAILRKGFQWLEGEQPTHEDIKDFFRKQPGEARRRKQKKNKEASSSKPKPKRKIEISSSEELSSEDDSNGPKKMKVSPANTSENETSEEEANTVYDTEKSSTVNEREVHEHITPGEGNDTEETDHEGDV